jgi:tetratricopeptide (TPR) repeat protein
MNARVLPSTGQAAAQNELLAQLGLPPSASPEDLDDLHLAASEYLAAAPASLRGWAHAQARALDAAYLKLTDPVGLEGSALRSPMRPPTVVPGGPATPPARRDSVPATTFAFLPVEDESDEPSDEPSDETSADEGVADLDALYAMVTPSAHEDMAPDRAARAAAPAPRAVPGRATRKARQVPPATIVAQPAASSGGAWKRVAIGLMGLIAVAAVAIGVNVLVNGDTAATNAAQASQTAPAIDTAKVADLMAQYQANPTDVSTLLALADEFYAGQQYSDAATWLDKALAIEPDNVQGLLARGAVSFNLDDLPAAEATWNKVVVLAPDNQEVHYDLGFLYLNQTTPDWDGVQREWAKVIAIDPTTSLAQLVQQHLDSLAAASMLPASPAPSGAASQGPAASPAAATPAAPSPAVSSPAAASPAGSSLP